MQVAFKDLKDFPNSEELLALYHKHILQIDQENQQRLADDEEFEKKKDKTVSRIIPLVH